MTDHPTGLMESFDAFVHHRHHDPAATTTELSPATTTPQENPMSKLTEAKTVIEDVAVHIRELAANPLIDAIAEAGLGLVLTPGEITFLTGMIREFEQARANAQQQAQPVA